MAKYGNGTNYAKQLDPSSANIVDPGLLGGKVRVFQDYCTLGASSLNSTDYIVVGSKLPTGAQVVDVVLTAGAPLATASALLVVGDEGDADRYITSTLLTANAVTVGPKVAGGMYYTVTGTTDNYIRVAGAATNAVLSGATVKISVMYVVE